MAGSGTGASTRVAVIIWVAAAELSNAFTIQNICIRVVKQSCESCVLDKEKSFFEQMS